MPTIIKAPPRRKTEEEAHPSTRPENAASGGYTWFQCAAFMMAGYAVLLAMCAIGRAGA